MLENVNTGLVAMLSMMLVAHGAMAGEQDEIAAFETQVEAFAVEGSGLEPAEGVIEAMPVSMPAAMAVSRETDLDKANVEIDRLKQVVAGLWDRLKREQRNSHYNMGYVYKVCRQYERAEQEFIKALELDPTDPGLHYNLGILYDDDLKNRTKARHHYEMFLELAPNDTDVPQVTEWLMAL